MIELIWLLLIGLFLCYADLQQPFPSSSKDLEQLFRDSSKLEPLYQSHLQHLFDKHLLEFIWSFREYPLRIEQKKLLRLTTSLPSSERWSLEHYDPCQPHNLLTLFSVAQTPTLSIDFLVQNSSHPFQTSKITDVPVPNVPSKQSPSSGEKRSSAASVLIVFTTCNQLQMTVASLFYLRNINRFADLIIIDDHSTDGTVEFLRKRGFAVISKPKARGLTDSWNIGYRLANALGYRNIIFSNNDVLLTSGSIKFMTHSLGEFAVVVPLTTQKGAGHHPPQSINNAYRLPGAFSQYVDDYRNAETIQEAIMHKQFYSNTGPRGCRAQLSKNRQGPHFNGFCFSVNVEKIKQAAFEDNIFLFDPSEVIVGQEDSLAKRMKASGLSPIIIHCAFVYHFKSVTVSSANFETFKQKVQKHNITVHRLGKTAMTELVFYDASQQKTIRKRFDIREDLRWYHADFDDEFLIKRIFEEDTNESSNVLDLLKSASKDHVIDSCQHGVNATTLFPLYSFSDWKQQSTKTTTVLRAIWRDLSLNLKQSSPCMYPSLWDEKCLEMIIPSSQDSPKYMDMQIFGRVPTKGKLVIAFVVPDLSHTTNLHDNFVIRQAYALGKSLEDGHSNVKVKYLRQESTRYSLDSLHDVDILMILQHSYDLPRMLALLQDNGRDSYQESSSTFCSKKHRVKANILTIAWLLDESLMSWLLQPWIGNYDFLLTSSMIAKLAIQKIIDEVGLTTSCSIACPRLSPLSTRSSVYSTEYLPSKYSFVAKKEERSRTRALEEEEDKTWEFPKSRSQAMVDVLPPVISNALSLGVEEAQSFQNNRNVEDVVRMATRKTKELDFLVVSVQTNNHQKFVSQVFESKAMWTKGKAMEFHFTNSTTSSVTSSGSNSDNYNFDAIISPEELLPLFRKVKLVVDNANQEATTWGTVSSVVIDALHGNALPISNNRMAILTTFGEALSKASLSLPVFDKVNDLQSLMHFYLQHEDIRKKTILAMQSVLSTERSMKSLSSILQPLLTQQFLGKRKGSLDFQKVKGASYRTRNLKATTEKQKTKLCVAVTTSREHVNWIAILIQAFITQYSQSSFKTQIDLSLILLDVDHSAQYSSVLLNLAEAMNNKHSDGFLHVFFNKKSSSNAHKHGLAYENMDALLQLLLALKTCPSDFATDGNKVTGRDLPSCDWIMFTKGDSMYNVNWFDKTAPLMLQSPSAVEMIAWDFIARQKGENQTEWNQIVTVDINTASVERGSMMIRSELYVKANTKYVNDAIFTKDLHSRDRFMLQSLTNHTTSNDTIHFLHECLLTQQ